MFRVLYNSTVIPCYAPGAIRAEDYSKMLLWLVCSGVAEEIIRRQIYFILKLYEKSTNLMIIIRHDKHKVGK